MTVENFKVTLSLLLMMFCVVRGNAQDLNDELKQNYNLLNSSTAANKEAAGIKLEQLAAKWPKQWAANYYAAYADAVISTNLSKAKPYFEKARELFAKQDASSIEKPSWGEKENAGYLAQCNE